jgi:hypothetical protein
LDLVDLLAGLDAGLTSGDGTRRIDKRTTEVVPISESPSMDEFEK